MPVLPATRIAWCLPNDSRRAAELAGREHHLADRAGDLAVTARRLPASRARRRRRSRRPGTAPAARRRRRTSRPAARRRPPRAASRRTRPRPARTRGRCAAGMSSAPAAPSSSRTGERARSTPSSCANAVERGGLELLERELAEDRVVRVRDAEREALAPDVALVVAQVRLHHRAHPAVEADLVVGIDAGGDQRARGDQLEHRRGGRPDVGGEPPVERRLRAQPCCLWLGRRSLRRPASARMRPSGAIATIAPRGARASASSFSASACRSRIERQHGAPAIPERRLVVRSPTGGERDAVEIEQRGGGSAGAAVALTGSPICGMRLRARPGRPARRGPTSGRRAPRPGWSARGCPSARRRRRPRRAPASRKWERRIDLGCNVICPSDTRIFRHFDVGSRR